MTLNGPTDQVFCHCGYLHSNFHWQFVTVLHDGSLYGFYLLAESYETINQSIENKVYGKKSFLSKESDT